MILLLNFYSAFSSAVRLMICEHKRKHGSYLAAFMPCLLKEEIYEFTNIARVYVPSGKGIPTFCRIVLFLPWRHVPLF